MIHFNSNRMAVGFFCGTLALWTSLPTYASAASKPQRLSVSDIAGYYITSDKSTGNQTLSLSFLKKTSKGNSTEQGNLAGNYGDFPIVGQGILSGGTDDDRTPNNMIQFDFMYIEPQDETLLMHSTSVMSNGKVVGLLINAAGVSVDGKRNVSVRYKRVSYTKFIRFLQTHKN